MNLIFLTWRNLLQNRARMGLTVLAAAIAVLTFILLRTVLGAWRVSAESAASDRLATRNKISLAIPLPRKYVESVRQVPGAASATFASLVALRDPRDAKNVFTGVAADPPSFLAVYSEISLSPAQRDAWFQDRQGAVLGDVLARRLGLHPGDRITLRSPALPADVTFTVDGIYEPLSKAIDRAQFVFHWDYLNASRAADDRDTVTWIASKVAGAASANGVSLAIDARFDDSEIQTTTSSERAMNLSLLGTISAAFSMLEAIAVIILGIMTLIVGNTLAMDVRQRKVQWGILLALGFSPWQVSTCILVEGLIVGLLSGGVGVALAYPLVQGALGGWLEENMARFFPYFRIEPATVVLSLALCAALGLVAAFIPARRAGSTPVLDSLRHVG